MARAGAVDLAGVDLSPAILRTAAVKLSCSSAVAVQLHAVDVEDGLPWPDAWFSVVVMTGVLHHFTRPRAVIQEVRRVLGPNGCFVLVEPRYPLLLHGLINTYLRILPHEGDHHYFREHEVERMCRSHGLRVVAKKHPSLYSFLLVFVPEER